MADNPALPMRDYFLANHISIVHDCIICQEKFDHDEHAPARLCGPNSCNHVFGASCLKTWLNSRMPGASTCPMCRKELFVSENDEYDSDDNDAEDGIFSQDEGRSLDDEYDDDMYSEDSEDSEDGASDTTPHGSEERDRVAVEEDVMDVDFGNAVVDLSSNDGTDASRQTFQANHPQSELLLPERKPVFCDGFSHKHRSPHDLSYLCDWPDAAAFTKKLWGELYNLYDVNYIYEDDLEVQVHAALRHSDASDHDYTSIGYREWPAVLEVARDMIREHFKNRCLVALDHKAMDHWLGKLGEALGWDLCGKYGDSCEDESDGLPCKGIYVNGW